MRRGALPPLKNGVRRRAKSVFPFGAERPTRHRIAAKQIPVEILAKIETSDKLPGADQGDLSLSIAAFSNERLEFWHFRVPSGSWTSWFPSVI